MREIVYIEYYCYMTCDYDVIFILWYIRRSIIKLIDFYFYEILFNINELKFYKFLFLVWDYKKKIRVVKVKVVFIIWIRRIFISE